MQPVTASFFPQVPQNSPFITTVATTAPTVPAVASPIPTPQPVSSPESEKETPVIPTWSTPEEARKVFEGLLEEVIQTPSTSWKDAVPLLMKDIRFTVGYVMR